MGKWGKAHPCRCKMEMRKLKKLRAYLKENPHLYYILFVPAFLLCFFSLESYIGPEQDYWSVYSPLDEHIPFIEYFVLPYYLWYPLLFSTGLILLLRDIPAFKKYMLFLIISFGGALLICLLVPNGQDLRPESFPRSNIFSSLVGLMYSMDTNTNVFPSMHVLGSVAAAAAVFKSEKTQALRPLWLLLAILISASTVFIKQHSILDVLGALVLALPIYMALYFRGRGEKK